MSLRARRRCEMPGVLVALALVGGAVGSGCATAPMTPPPHLERPPSTPKVAGPCEDFELDVRRVWSSETKAEISAGIVGVGGEWGQRVVLDVTTRLDAVSRGWVLMKESVCKDHLVRKTLPAEAYNRIASCLDTVLVRQSTLLAIAQSPSRDALSKMSETLQNIGDELHWCRGRALDRTYDTAADFSRADATGEEVRRTPDQQARSLLAEAQTLKTLVQYDAAKLKAKQALALTSEHQLALLRVDALVLSANLERHLGNYRGSEALARRAVVRAEAASYAEGLFRAVRVMAGAQIGQAKYKSAELSAKRAKALAAEGSKEASDAFFLLGRLYSRQAEYPRALENYNASLEIDLVKLGRGHPDIGAIYNNIAVVYDAQGEYSQALAVYEKALDIYLAALGEDHPATAAAYNNIGVVLRRQGDNAKALAVYQKALGIYVAALGEEHPSAAISYSNIGRVYEGKGDYERALALYQKALRIEEKALGKGHPDTAITYGHLGSVHDERGEYDSALAMYQTALDIKLRVFGEAHPSTSITYNNLGFVYEHQGDFDGALSMYEKALAIDRKVLPEGHPESAPPHHNIGRVSEKQGNLERALAMYKKTLSIRRQALGEEHKKTVAARRDIQRLCDGGYRPACD